MGGGGARSPLWRQIQADVYGQTVETVQAEEGAAYGAALLAGVGAGVWPSVDAACDAVVHVAKRTAPDPETVPRVCRRATPNTAAFTPLLRSIFPADHELALVSRSRLRDRHSFPFEVLGRTWLKGAHALNSKVA